MMKQSFHNMLRGVSVLPALLVVPAMADAYAPAAPFFDDYVAALSTQLSSVLAGQNSTGFEIGKIEIGTVEDLGAVNDRSLRYNVASRENASQYVKMENVTVPNGTGEMTVHIPSGVAYNNDYGLTSGKLSILKGVFGNQIEQTDGSAILTMTDLATKTSRYLPMVGVDNAPWLLSTAGGILESGKINDGYLYTDGNLVIDGDYGNMVNTFFATYETSLTTMFENIVNRLNTSSIDSETKDKVVRGMFGISLDDLVSMNKATAIRSYLEQVYAQMTGLDSLKLNVGEVVLNNGNVTFKNTVGLTSDNVAINGGTVTVDTGANLTITGADLNVASGVNLVNNGTLNANSTNVTLDSNLTGNGTLVIGENTTVNLGDANITQGTITLNGTMAMTLVEGAAARIDADSISSTTGDGKLNLTFTGEGTYNLFAGNGTFTNGVSNAVYDITWNTGNKSFVATAKSAAKIAEESEISQEAASTVTGLSESSSAVLNDLAVAMQEKLAEGTPEAKAEVEQATAAINPETESVTQSVASSVQTTVTNLASSRMAMPAAGRSAGDVNMVASGVWAQGLYNKTKMNDSFNGYTRGVAVGADGTLDNDVTIGIGYAFNHSDISSSSRDTDIDSNTIFVYGQYKPAEWYINAILNYTWSDYSEDGTAMGQPVTSEYDVGSFGAAVAGGYDFACGLTPELGLRYLHIGEVSYKGNLPGENKFDSTDYLTGSLGAKYGFNIVANEEMLFRPELRYAFKYDLVSDESSASVLMPGTAAYTLNGDRLPRVGNEFGIGLTMKYRTMDLSLTYDIDVRKDYTSQTGMLKFRYNF